MTTTTMEPGPSLVDRPAVSRPPFGRWMNRLTAVVAEGRRQRALHQKRLNDACTIGEYSDQLLRDIGLQRSEIIDVIVHGKEPLLITRTL
jgi:uncharacterized protein YjiS (DUF1127 family)